LGGVALDVFFESLLTLFRWPTLGLMLLGVAIGFVVGILPGLGGSVTLALMLPFVFRMDSPIDAFAFLLGMHAVVATTGDITSVLFAVPGEGTAAATILDGHPMTQRGEAGRALGAVLFSSLVGAVIGAAALALSVPVIRPVVLAFGPPEFLMLTVLGLSFVVALSRQAMLKGFIMAGFGFLVAMVGLDSQMGVPRYTLGQLYLWEGINLVPVVIGLFAVPEVLALMMTRTTVAREQIGHLAGAFQGVKDTFIHWWLTLRCSLIGVFIGIVPGMGGGVAQWVAYAHAQQTSPDPDKFGKGAIEGVLAAGSVNNSREGGDLIPTVAFGIPGSSAMAILLGAFLITGLQPGPDMLTTRLDVTFSMVWVLVLSNIIAVTVCFLFLQQLASMTQIKASMLVPFLVLFIAMGAYTAHNSFGDLILMLVFGAVGWAAVRWDWPRPPLLLALVLGEITERNLFLSTQLYGLQWLTFPIPLALLVITILGVAWPALGPRLTRLWRRERAKAG
jgi:TctA family transporter